MAAGLECLPHPAAFSLYASRCDHGLRAGTMLAYHPETDFRERTEHENRNTLQRPKQLKVPGVALAVLTSLGAGDTPKRRDSQKGACAAFLLDFDPGAPHSVLDRPPGPHDALDGAPPR